MTGEVGEGLISRGLTVHSRRFGLDPQGNGEPMRLSADLHFRKIILAAELRLILEMVN